MGEIADALRRANQAANASRPEPDAERRHAERPSGDIAAAMKRANAASDSAEVDGNSEVSISEPSPGESENASSERESPSVIPENLGKVIFHVERHRHLGLKLRTALDRGSARSLAIVSASRNEGKTVVACNIAASIASLYSERKVALVDLDLRNPSLARVFDAEVSIGIEQVLHGRATLDQTRIRLLEPEIDLYPAAQPHRAAHELLVLPAFETFIRDLEARYAAVIIDTPPSLLVPDSSLIMRSAGYCVVVARAGLTRAHRFEEMLDRLPAEKILGKVLNDVSLPSHSKDDDYYYYTDEGQQ